MTKIVDLGELTRGGEVHNLSGHERGLAARTFYALDDADEAGESVEVVVPSGVYTLTPSFFQGMFAKSVQAAGGNAGGFRTRFHFQASPIVQEQIDRGIASVGLDRDNLFAF